MPITAERMGEFETKMGTVVFVFSGNDRVLLTNASEQLWTIDNLPYFYGALHLKLDHGGWEPVGEIFLRRAYKPEKGPSRTGMERGTRALQRAWQQHHRLLAIAQ